LLVALAVVGCSTTQQQAARLQLNSARIRASQVALRLDGRDRAVVVTSVRAVAGRAIVVALRNDGATPVSDLPLLVRIASARYLNGAAGMPYFQTHVPAIAAHGRLQWVLTLARRLPPRAPLVARVGRATVTPAVKALPEVRIARSGGVVTVRNDSSIPQYQLPVYAVASRGGRYVAAGQTTIADLGAGAQVRLRVPLVGDPSGATLSLEAPPSIFN
jgi:hypothetical protein